MTSYNAIMNEKYELGFSPLKSPHSLLNVNKSKLDFSLSHIYFSLKFNFLPPSNFKIYNFIQTYQFHPSVDNLRIFKGKQNKSNRKKKSFCFVFINRRKCWFLLWKLWRKCWSGRRKRRWGLLELKRTDQICGAIFLFNYHAPHAV